MMTEKTFHISGKVKNLENQGVPDLRVEAWDKDLFIDDFVAEAVTDPDGRFHMSFPDKRFRELAGDVARICACYTVNEARFRLP